MKIKICGLTKVEDAILAVSLGATHIGLNFFPPSPRYVDKQKALSITNVISKLENPPIIVGIFVNESALKKKTAARTTTAIADNVNKRWRVNLLWRTPRSSCEIMIYCFCIVFLRLNIP